MAGSQAMSGQVTSPAQPVYSAFISYSHNDAAKVRKLHSRLEAYRLPRQLGSITQADGGGADLPSGRLGKVFRDREDLSAAQDLSAAIIDALDRSRVLIVACSPAAGASRWVNQEILYFKQRHPDRRILAVILEGDPAVAFPPALTEGGAEPAAADLRKEGDGWRLGFLKTVAGIADKPLDALVQRDSQRQLHRVIAITGMVTVIALAMGVMTTIALHARDEAQFQRDQANGFVESLLTKLQPVLVGKSNTQARSEIYGLAAEYYQTSGLDGFRDDHLESRARLFHAWGAEDQRQGDHDAALVKYELAHGATKALLERSPSDPARKFAHAQSEYWIGDVAYRRGDWNAAEASWLAYRALALALYRSDPSNPAWAAEAGFGEGNICTLELQRSDQTRPDFAKAQSACAASMRYFEEAAALEPDNRAHRIAIANRHAWLADIFTGQGQAEKALEHRYSGERVVNQLLRDDPENLDWLDLWIGTQIGIITAELRAGQHDSAASRKARARSVLARMIARDPKNIVWKQYSLTLESVK